jgi:hypothetical protein
MSLPSLQRSVHVVADYTKLRMEEEEYFFDLFKNNIFIELLKLVYLKTRS